MYLSSVIFRLWKWIFCIISVKGSFSWVGMGTYSFVWSLVYQRQYLRDWYVPGWQALEIEAEMSGIQSLPFNKRYTRGIEIAVGMWKREPEYTWMYIGRFSEDWGSQKSFLGLERLTSWRKVVVRTTAFLLSPLFTAPFYLTRYRILPPGLKPLYWMTGGER